MTFQQVVDSPLSKLTTAGEARAMRSDHGSSDSTKSSGSIHTVRGKQQAGRWDNQGNSQKRECCRCGRHHSPDECWFKIETCRFCKKKGHNERKCQARSKSKTEVKQRDFRSTKGKTPGQKKKGGHGDVHKMHENEKGRSSSRQEARESDDSSRTSSEEGDVEYDRTMFKLKVVSKSKIRPSSGSESKVAQMELDTGSSVSMIPLSYYEKHLPHLKMHKSEKSLASFITNQTVKPMGKVHVKVKYGKYHGGLSFYVVEMTEYLIFGRDLLAVIPLD